MAQYSFLSTNGTDTIELTDGVFAFRVQVRDTDLCFDQALTSSPGFNGIENVDWANISISTLSSGMESFRIGARDASWIIDQAKTVLGFDGVENTDWEGIEEHNL